MSKQSENLKALVEELRFGGSMPKETRARIAEEALDLLEHFEERDRRMWRAENNPSAMVLQARLAMLGHTKREVDRALNILSLFEACRIDFKPLKKCLQGILADIDLVLRNTR
jgi:hypothetical protein